ncbi:MAG: hypothetical protein MJZ00_07280 [Paludibacteraceae bacterium]|nr:hypothetical protein [Paludibacteraceae bacterium]
MKNLLFFLLGALYCFAIGLIRDRYFPSNDEKYKERTIKVIQKDTIVRFVSIPNVIIYRDIPLDVDTAEIIRDYFASVTYTDTIVSGGNATVSISETIEQNRIKEREVHLLTTTSIVSRPTSDALIIGATASADPSLFCLWQHKKWGFGGGFAFASRTPYISITHTLKNW